MTAVVKLTDRRVARIAAELGITIEQVHGMLDEHAVTTDRVAYVRRVLALELLRLDQIEEVFHDKALNGDVQSGMLCVKIAERRATLLGLNPPTGHSVTLVAHQEPIEQSSTDRIEAAIARIAGRKLDTPDDDTAH